MTFHAVRIDFPDGTRRYATEWHQDGTCDTCHDTEPAGTHREWAHDQEDAS